MTELPTQGPSLLLIDLDDVWKCCFQLGPTDPCDGRTCSKVESRPALMIPTPWSRRLVGE